MAAALTALGSRVDTSGDDWAVTPGAFDRRRRGRLRAGRHGDAVRAAGRRPVHAARSPSTATRTCAAARSARSSPPCARLGVDVEDDGRGALPFAVRGTGSVPRRHGRHRRVRVLAVRLRAAAGRRALRRGRRRPPRRQAGAVAPPHRHDRRDAARARRRGRRRRRQPLGGRARAGQAGRPRRSSPTCPTPRRSWPWPRSPAARSRSATGRARPPRPATRCARSSPRWAATVDARRRRPDRSTGTGTLLRASTSTCTTSASSPRRSPRSARSPTAPSPPARHRAHPRPRDRPAGRARHRARRARRRRDRARRTGCQLPARRRCTAASSTPTPTTGWRTPA